MKKAITLCDPNSTKHLQTLPQAIVFFQYCYFGCGLAMMISAIATFAGTLFEPLISMAIVGVFIGMSLGYWFNYTAFWAARTKNQMWLGASAAGFALLGLNAMVGIWDSAGAFTYISIVPLPGLVKLVEAVLMLWQAVMIGFAAKTAPEAEAPLPSVFPGMAPGKAAGATSIVPAGAVAVPKPKNGKELVGAGGDQGPPGHVMMTAP